MDETLVVGSVLVESRTASSKESPENHILEVSLACISLTTMKAF